MLRDHLTPPAAAGCAQKDSLVKPYAGGVFLVALVVYSLTLGWKSRVKERLDRARRLHGRCAEL
jgi:hypothetical protein